MSSEIVAAYAVLTSVGIVLSISIREIYQGYYARGLKAPGAVYQVIFLACVWVVVCVLYSFLAGLAGSGCAA